jgi:hypothetical protein
MVQSGGQYAPENGHPQLRIRVVTLGDLKQPRATAFYEHPPSSTPLLDFAARSWESQINRYELFAWAPKKLTKN